MNSMNAAAVTDFGPAENLRTMQLPVPIPGPEEVQVKVAYAGVQPADAAARAGWRLPGSSPSMPMVPGNDFSGVVTDVGSEVSSFEPGDEVLGYRMLGSYAEYLTVSADQLVPKPPSVGWAEAAALSASGQTADTVLDALRVTAGETLLVHGAAGGVGSMVVQLAWNRAAVVIGTASPQNHAHLRQLGATPVSYGEGQLERIREAADGPIHAALDASGQGSLHIATQVVPDTSRIATIADPQLAEELGLQMLRSDRSAARLGRLVDLVSTGDLQMYIRRIYPLAEAAEAHREIETGHGRGKVVLSIGGDL
ncbi:NADP-dependent oxidoreductase [Nesterenkonia sedimenti]|nr:NADP-dependent oxidoreductase [Nesterenkonia sedimenti]